MALDFIKNLYNLFIDMSFYLMLGLLFVGILNEFISKEWVSKHTGKAGFGSIIKSSLFGVPLPLCSCGVLPTAIYLNKNGATMGAVIAFLISTPQTGVDSIIATYGTMGILFAIFRPVAAFLSGIIGGTLVEAFIKGKKEKLELDETCETGACCTQKNEDVLIKQKKQESIIIKIKRILKYSYMTFLNDIAGHFVVGLLISALIAVIIPDNWFNSSILGSGIFSMIFMIIIGIPMYICSTSSIPIALILMAKGLSPGAAFVFLFAGPVTNAASLAVLSKTLGRKVTSLYVLTVSVLSIAFGLILDLLISVFDFKLPEYHQHMAHNHISTFELIIAGIFFLLVIKSLFSKFLAKVSKTNTKSLENTNEIILNVDGMTCSHCAAHVKNEIEEIDTVDSAVVNLSKKEVVVKGRSFTEEEIKKAIEKAGYRVI